MNRAAVAELLAGEARPVHVLCAGSEGQPTLEDTLLAGALVEALAPSTPVLDDGAKLARAAWREMKDDLLHHLLACAGGDRLRALAYDDDVRAAARCDVFALVPEVRRRPFRVEAGPVA